MGERGRKREEKGNRRDMERVGVRGKGEVISEREA